MVGVDRRSGDYAKRIREKFFLSVHKNGVRNTMSIELAEEIIQYL